jgi:hypothetical protein
MKLPGRAAENPFFSVDGEAAPRAFFIVQRAGGLTPRGHAGTANPISQAMAIPAFAGAATMC